MSLHKFNYTKMSATGNDFLFLNLLDLNTSGALKNQLNKREQLARKMCDRHFGLGADGLVFVEKDPSEKCDLKWDFYNSDGSTAEMCGNAARCMARYAPFKNLAPNKFSFLTAAGPILAESHQETASVTMTPPSEFKDQTFMEYRQYYSQQIESGEEGLYYFQVDTGVPHVVINVQFLVQDQQTKEVAEFFQDHQLFQPQSTNVTFYSILYPDEIHSMTFERGVRDFTLSCGTGAVASAYIHYLSTQKNKIRVNVPGGTLYVDFSNVNQPILSGPATFVAEMTTYNED